MTAERERLRRYAEGLAVALNAEKLASMLHRSLSKPVAGARIGQERRILYGATRRVSIMFADIRGFTAMSGNAGADATVALLNEYFAELANAVLMRGGILDKYVGDAVMAVFGLPLPRIHDPARCVGAAAAMVRGLRLLNHLRQARGAPPIDVAIGIDTGDAVVGNIGCETPFTAIGDTANVAARIESVNKLYGTTILLSERTAPPVAKRFRLREIDQVRLTAARPAIRIYEVLIGWSAGERKALPLYRTGLALYRAGNWALGEAYFRAALSVRPEDGPSQMMIERCRRFRSEPPGRDWDGVWRMHAKQRQR